MIVYAFLIPIFPFGIEYTDFKFKKMCYCLKCLRVMQEEMMIRQEIKKTILHNLILIHRECMNRYDK